MGAELENAGLPERSAPLSRSRRTEGGRTGRRKKRGPVAVLLFLIFGAAPAGIAVWYFTLEPETQQQILARIPAGAGGRAIKAAICVALLFALAKIALPAFFGTGSMLRSGLVALRAKPTALRVLFFPAEAVLWLLWFAVQLLFAIDAVLIVATSVATLVLVARILKPDLLSDVLPEILL